MGPAQLRAVLIGIIINAIDGFDVLSIAFASPGIAAEWQIERAALGVVLSMELVGMALGALFIGRLSDRIGRRSMLLLCLALMTVTMVMCATAQNVTTLAFWRLITGIGLGGVFPALNAIVTEFSNDRRRDLCVSALGAGYAAGAVLGGSAAALLLTHFDWRSVFILGGTLTSIVALMTFLWVPESVAFLTHSQRADALEKINRTLRRFGHAEIAGLASRPADTSPRPSIARLFSPELARNTMSMLLAYLFHISTFYFVMKWTPKIIADMGHSTSSAALTLVWANVGGIIGCLILGLLATRLQIRTVTFGAMLLTTLFVIIFGRSSPELEQLMALAGATGFFASAAIGGLGAVMGRSFPHELRASGIGLVMGIGRGGAALSPIAAGFLFGSGMTLPGVALVMGMGSAIAAAFLLLCRPRY